MENSLDLLASLHSISQTWTCKLEIISYINNYALDIAQTLHEFRNPKEANYHQQVDFLDSKATCA